MTAKINSSQRKQGNDVIKRFTGNKIKRQKLE